MSSTIPSSTSISSPPSSLNKSLQLDIDKIREAKADKQKEEHQALGPEVKVIFELPTTNTYEALFRVGWTVGYLKLALESKLSIPYYLQELYYNDKIMCDPLSLRDYPIRSAEPLRIKVKVLKEEEAIKQAKEEQDDEE